MCIRDRYWNHAAAWCILFRQQALALRFYERMLAQDRSDTLALASIGFRYAEQGRRQDALAMFDRVIAIEPGNAEAHFNRGFLLQQGQDHLAAIAAFERATELNPAHDRAWYGMGLSMIALRRFEDAVAPLKH